MDWGAVAALAAFYGVIFGVALWASRRHRGTPDQLMLAGRNLPLGLAAFTMAATWVGGGYINGTAEAAYATGPLGIQAPWGYALSLVVGGLFYAPIMRRHGFTTMLDPLQQRFGERFGSLLYFPAFVGEVFWSAAILTALGSTFGTVFGLDVATAIIASGLVAIGYTLIGGLWAVAVTDVLQLIVLVVGLTVIVPVVAGPLGGVAEMWATYAEQLGDEARWTPSLAGWRQDAGFWSWWDAALLLVFGGIPWHVYFQRVLASKDAHTARWLSLAAAPVCLLAAAPAVLIGAVAAVTDWASLGLAAPEPALALPWVLRHLGGPVIASVGLAAIAAAVMSSVDSSILSAASMGAWNLYRPLVRPAASSADLARAVRIGVAIVGSLALLLALRVGSVYGLWFLSSDLVYCVLFPQLTLALFDRRATPTGAKAAFFVAVALRLAAGEASLGIPGLIPYPADPVTGAIIFPFRTFTMACGLLTHMTVSRWFSREDPVPLRTA
jgi:high affinity choline transporter 7